MSFVPDFGVTEKYRTIVIIAILLVGAFLGWLVIFFGYFSNILFAWTDAHREFSRDARFLVWLLLTLIQTAAWPILFLLVIGRIREINAYYRDNNGEIFLSAVVFLLAAVAIGAGGVLGPDLPNWLPGYETKLMILTGGAITVALASAVGIWRAQGALRKVIDEIDADETGKRQLDRLLHLKEVLAVFLSTLGILL
jgi:hypothetical protein